VEQRAGSILDWQVVDAEGVPQAGPRPLEQLLATGRPVLDICHAMAPADGTRRILSTNATPLFDAAGKHDGVVVTVEDITERLALAAQLRQSQKMEVVGQLAAGVAHDINNILTIIQGHTGLLLQTATAESHTIKSLKQIAAAADRAAGFVRHLLTFSRKQVAHTRILDLNAVLQNLEGMLPQMLGEQIRLELRCQPGLPLVAADVSMTEQIVMNLVVNARDAMPQGGTLYVETAAAEIPVALTRQNPDARAGRFICLSVRDTGCGMERRVKQRIFEPFFTTKEVGKGTGLGLSTVYGIVRQHAGWIEVESEPGAGALFKVFLPIAETAQAVPEASQTVKAEPGGGTETILAVEDEVSLLILLRRVLERYHYHVLVATSAAEALKVWEEHAGRIDLLLTDVIMPGRMTGNDLVKELKKRQPGLRVIITSGYSSELLGQDFYQEDCAFLAKPYEPQRVAQLVRKMLDRPPQPVHPAHPATPIPASNASLVPPAKPPPPRATAAM
jgi:signal transduction histidine kinase/FixJ family two-component response regulator